MADTPGRVPKKVPKRRADANRRVAIRRAVKRRDDEWLAFFRRRCREVRTNLVGAPEAYADQWRQCLGMEERAARDFAASKGGAE